jgi:predicted transcriptional regulator
MNFEGTLVLCSRCLSCSTDDIFKEQMKANSKETVVDLAEEFNASHTTVTNLYVMDLDK